MALPGAETMAIQRDRQKNIFDYYNMDYSGLVVRKL
jgi:hypothetical protein